MRVGGKRSRLSLFCSRCHLSSTIKGPLFGVCRLYNYKKRATPVLPSLCLRVQEVRRARTAALCARQVPACRPLCHQPLRPSATSHMGVWQ